MDLGGARGATSGGLSVLARLQRTQFIFRGGAIGK
jgi:hypothetical protein